MQGPEPTIIEGPTALGARSEVVEGCIVREGSVCLGMGVYIRGIDQNSGPRKGEVFYGEVPAVVGRCGRVHAVKERCGHLYCAVIVKRRDEKPLENLVNELIAR